MADTHGLKKLTETTWVLHTSGLPVGFVFQGKDSVELLTGDKRSTFASMDEFKQKIGGKISEIVAVETPDSDSQEVGEIDGFPIKHKNVKTESGGDRPVYLRGKTQHVAGYWCLKFSKRWVPSFCPLLRTAEQYDSVGPFKDKFEMMANVATLNNSQ